MYISPELDQTFGDEIHVIHDSLAQSRDFSSCIIAELETVVESVRFEIDGALHDSKRFLGVIGVEGRPKGVAAVFARAEDNS